MTPRGVPDGDMPDRPQPEYWGYPPFGDGDLDAWLSGYTAATPPAVDEALSALLAPPSRAELTGETRALAEFRRTHRSRGHQLPMMWLASAAALIVLICGAAAVTGRLPTPIQNLAHVVFASQPAHSASPSASPAASHVAPSRQVDTRTAGEPTRSPDWAPTSSGPRGPDARNTPGAASPPNGKGGSVFRRGGFATGGSSPGNSGPSGSYGASGGGR